MPHPPASVNPIHMLGRQYDILYSLVDHTQIRMLGGENNIRVIFLRQPVTNESKLQRFLSVNVRFGINN